jgi:hypothetical protein
MSVLALAVSVFGCLAVREEEPKMMQGYTVCAISVALGLVACGLLVGTGGSEYSMKRSMYLHEGEWPCQKYIEKVESRSHYDLMKCTSKENMVRVWEGTMEGRWVEDQVESYGCLNSQGCEEVMRETVDWGVNMVILTSGMTAAAILVSSIVMFRMLKRIGNGSEKVYWHHESIEKSFMVMNSIIVIASAIWIGLIHRNGPHVFSHS